MIKNRRGQMAIWIIIAVAMLGIIILFFILRGKNTLDLTSGIEENPKAYLTSCAREETEKVLDIILPQGGFVEPEHAKMVNGVNVSYLCYNAGNYNPCLNEHPMLLREIEQEIKANIEKEVDNCYKEYATEMKKRNADVTIGREMLLNVSLRGNFIRVEIERKLDIKKNEESYSLNSIDIDIESQVYNLAKVAMEIASQEAKYCYFEYGGYMLLYPEFKISRKPYSDDSSVYSITHKKSGKIMNIAIRSCAIPPGF